MIRSFILFIVILIFASCKHDIGIFNEPIIEEEIMEEEIMEVDTIPRDTIPMFACFDRYIHFSNSPCIDEDDSICLIAIEGLINIPNRSKLFFPQFCLEENDELIFKNQDGSTASFEIIEKERTIKCVGNPAYEQSCMVNSNVVPKYYANIEVASLKLYAETLDYQFKIVMMNQMDIHAGQGALYGTALRILRYTGPSNGTFEFEKIIGQGTLPFSTYDGETYFPSLVLNEQSFSDVFSYDSNGGTPGTHFDFFYNKEFGLIGFKDMDGNTWNLE